MGSVSSACQLMLSLGWKSSSVINPANYLAMIILTNIPRCVRLRKIHPLVKTNALHTTRLSSDFFSWFKKKKEERPEPTTPAKGTQDLIKDIEAGKETKVSNNQKLELIPANFIGEDPEYTKKRTREKLIKQIPFNSWLSSNKVLKLQDLEGILIESYNSSFSGGDIISVTDSKFNTNFPDLVTKFKFTKSLQAKSGYLIPDFKLTTLNTPSQFKEYYCKEFLSGKQAKFKESEPNAIDLSAKQYNSPNVYVVPDVDVKSRNKTYRKILKDVYSMEAETARKAIEQARRG